MIGNSLLGHKAPAALADVRKRLEEEFTESLQRNARAANWPEDIASRISVKRGDSGYRVDIPESHEGSAMDLEYGTQTTPPSAVLRKFMSRLGSDSPGKSVTDILGGVL